MSAPMTENNTSTGGAVENLPKMASTPIPVNASQTGQPPAGASFQPRFSIDSLAEPLVRRRSSILTNFAKPKSASRTFHPSSSSETGSGSTAPQVASYHPLPLQLGGHAGRLSTDPTGSLIIKRACPREVAFYIYLQSLARELHAEELERIQQVLWESHGLGRALSTGRGLLETAGNGLWNAQERVLGASQSAGQILGNAGWAVGKQVEDLASRAGAGKGRLRALTVSSIEWGRPSPVAPAEENKTSPSAPNELPTAQSTASRLSSLFNKFPKLPLPVSNSGGLAFSNSTGSPTDEISAERIGLEPEEEHGVNENAARKDAEDIKLVDGQAAIPADSSSTSGTEQVKDLEAEDGRARAEKLLKEMKGVKLSKGKGKERTGSVSAIGSGSGSPRLLPVANSSSTLKEIVEHKEQDRSIRAGGIAPVLDTAAPPPGKPEASTESPHTERKEVDQRVYLAKLIPFLPKFHGTIALHGNEDDAAEAVVLQNVLSSFTHPAAVDIKLGTVLYDATAGVSEEKRIKMEQKAQTTTSAKTGMKFSGFQTWNDATQQFVMSPREYGTNITVDQLPEAFARYTPVDVVSPSASIPPERHRNNILRVLSALSKTLHSLRDAISELDIRFVGASVLIVYEGGPVLLDKAWRAADQGKASANGLDLVTAEEEVESGPPRKGQTSKATRALNEKGTRLTEDAAEFEMDTSLLADPESGLHPDEKTPGNSGTATPEPERETDAPIEPQPVSPFQVRLIDFAHTRLAPGEGRDEGFLLGLRALIGLVDGRSKELGLGTG